MNADSFIFLIFLFGFAIILSAIILFVLNKSWKADKKETLLSRHHKNPVLSPTQFDGWEGAGVFNPAAVMDDGGRIHIVYRAVGSDGLSRFGYAVSEDGGDFSDKSPYPIFAMHNPRRGIINKEPEFNPIMYPSGGSWGGCEDPRMVRLDGKIYLTFNAFDGWDYIRMAVSSINEQDFFNRKWKWSKPMLISSPGEIHKNWVLFPEKINGKFAILHSISPEVQIDFVDRLEDLSIGTKKIKSHFGQKSPRKSWDSWLRGAGAPPVKTTRGWLLLYHAASEGQNGYKLGAMLLDLNDPRRVLARSRGPVLTANEWYENDWKPGVVYACGAVIKDDELFVYYGGGDKHVCVAHASLEKLLDSLDTI